MLQIKDTLVSGDLLEKKFCCDLSTCKGACCVKGDSGAPLSEEEVELLPKLIEAIRPFLRPEGIEAVEQQGTHVIDQEHDTVTPLVNNEECAYAVFEDGIALCGIEKAYAAGRINFRKPVSCHLYPVRIKSYKNFTAVNYNVWDICEPARILGESASLPVYEFVRDALVRYFGEEWYGQLHKARKK